MDENRFCGPCMMSRIVVAGLLLWGVWAAIRHYLA